MRYTGCRKCVSSAPCRPSTFQRRILSLQDMVRSRSPSRMPSHVGTMSLDSTGMVPSPVEGLGSEPRGPLGQATPAAGLLRLTLGPRHWWAHSGRTNTVLSAGNNGERPRRPLCPWNVCAGEGAGGSRQTAAGEGQTDSKRANAPHAQTLNGDGARRLGGWRGRPGRTCRQSKRCGEATAE